MLRLCSKRSGTNTSRTWKGGKKLGEIDFLAHFSLSVLHCWLSEHDNVIPETWFCDNSFLKSSFMTNRFCYVWIRVACRKKDTDNFFRNVIIISRREMLFVYLRRSPCEISMVTGLTFEGSFENSNVTHTLKVLSSRSLRKPDVYRVKDAAVEKRLSSMSSILINTQHDDKTETIFPCNVIFWLLDRWDDDFWREWVAHKL